MPSRKPEVAVKLPTWFLDACFRTAAWFLDACRGADAIRAGAQP